MGSSQVAQCEQQTLLWLIYYGLVPMTVVHPFVEQTYYASAVCIRASAALT